MPRILELQYFTKLNLLLYFFTLFFFAFSSYFTVRDSYFIPYFIFARSKLLYGIKISKTELRAARKANRPILNGLGSHNPVLTKFCNPVLN